MPGALQVVIVYKKDSIFGLTKDANTLANTLPAIGRSVGCPIAPVKIVDVREPPQVCDICIHLEVPQPVWFPWAKSNVMMGNHEWWCDDQWKGYWSQFDVGIFRDQFSLNTCTKSATPKRLAAVIPWFVNGAKPLVKSERKGIVWFLGGSVNKRAAAEAILPLWKDTYPELNVYTTETLLDGTQLPTNVHIHVGYLKDSEKSVISSKAAGHICISKAESLGYTALEAEAEGAWMLLNTLPCFKEYFGNNINNSIGWLETPCNEAGVADFSSGLDLDAAIQKFTEFSTDAAAKQLDMSLARKTVFMTEFGKVIQELSAAIQVNNPLPRHMPPLLNANECPSISIITLVHGRPKFIENACLNLLSTDYPQHKIEWVVVDDSPSELSPSNRVIKFQQQFKGKVTYVPLVKKTSIGAKRNIGVEKAQHDILLMMDDDDHYPVTSFRRRVAYLTKAKQQYECAVCTTIAMYDLQTGISAVNVPPFRLSLGERCSEATLTFTRSFWKARPFKDISMAEGEDFLTGRETMVAEIPPQQIIVALTHSNNTSRRKVPEGNPGCFWGFPRQLLEFLHGLVGVKVEAA